MNIKWNADAYTQQFRFVPEYGENLLSLAAIRPGQRILDLGCGTGELTHKIASMGAKVIGMDASKDMLTKAKEKYPDLEFLQGDGTSFVLRNPVDIVFSNSVFHWIEDQDTLLKNVAQALKSGGSLVCEFGGKGCAETIHSALEKTFAYHGHVYQRTQYFPTIGEYTPLLERQGFKVVYAELFDRFTPLQGTNGVADWISMFLTQPFKKIADDEKQQIIHEAQEYTREKLFTNNIWHADYVRIRFIAIKV